MLKSKDTLIIGVDGGGTGCRAAIGTQARGMLALAEGEAANATTDLEITIQNIISTVNAATVKAGFSLDQLSQANAHLGLAGAISESLRSQISQTLPYGKSVVTDDRPTAIVGALCGQDGYLVSVGTGTIIAASTSKTFQYVGGWGYQVSDQGSGAWLGRAALEHVLLCHDGLADHSDLSLILFEKFKNNPNLIVNFSTSARPKDFGSLAPTVISGAKSGDIWAQRTLQAGADYLMSGLKRLGFCAGDPLCLVGGLGLYYANYLHRDALTGLMPAKGTALDGAFALARTGSSLIRKKINDYY